MNLKPCPFCGETPERLNDGSNEVVCHTCDLWGMKVSEWNRRQDNTKAEALKLLKDIYNMNMLPGSMEIHDCIKRLESEIGGEI